MRRLVHSMLHLTSSAAYMGNESFRFGPHVIAASSVFYSTPLSYVTVNISPILKGHVLVIPKRENIQRVSQLTENELEDLIKTARKVANMLEQEEKATAFNFAIQDGKDAGQSVPHVHLHVLPRRPGDFAHNDQVYEELENISKQRRKRSIEEMAVEAKRYRELMLQQK